MDSRELGHITSDLSAYDTMGNPEIMQIALINEKIRRQERNQNAWRRIFLYFIPVSYTHLTLPTKLEV